MSGARAFRLGRSHQRRAIVRPRRLLANAIAVMESILPELNINCCERELGADCAAIFGVVLHRDMPAVGLGDRATNRKSQACSIDCAAPRRIGAVEAIKDARQVGDRNPCA